MRLRRHFSLLLSQVRRELLIANAYFLPGPRILRRLRRLAARGRRVVLLLPGVTDQAFVQAASRHLYGQLLSSGVRILERAGTMLHAKAVLLDGEALLAGSANLDPRSFRHNLELNILVRQPALVAEARGHFVAQLAQARPCDPAAWVGRPWRARAWSWFAYRFRWWL
jgi:cardiolipin synthase